MYVCVYIYIYMYVQTICFCKDTCKNHLLRHLELPLGQDPLELLGEAMDATDGMEDG